MDKQIKTIQKNINKYIKDIKKNIFKYDKIEVFAEKVWDVERGFEGIPVESDYNWVDAAGDVYTVKSNYFADVFNQKKENVLSVIYNKITELGFETIDIFNCYVIAPEDGILKIFCEKMANRKYLDPDLLETTSIDVTDTFCKSLKQSIVDGKFGTLN